LLIGRPTLELSARRILVDWRRNWRLARWGLAGAIVGCAAAQLMPWIMALMRDESQAGLLAACTTLMGVPTMVIIGLMNFFTPKMAHQFSRCGVPGIRPVLTRAALGSASIAVAFLLFVAATGDLLPELFYGHDYAGCGRVVLVLALAVVANAFGMVAGHALSAVERPREAFIPNVCMTLVWLGGALNLVPEWGVMGAACAGLAGAATGAALKLIALRRVLLEAATAVDEAAAAAATAV
jgi:O-antigen/teichoic acid export membrane protein